MLIYFLGWSDIEIPLGPPTLFSEPVERNIIIGEENQQRGFIKAKSASFSGLE